MRFQTAAQLGEERRYSDKNLQGKYLMQKFRDALPRAAGDPQISGRVHYGLALCLLNRGKAQQAVPEFDQAIARVPEVAEFYYWRGMARRQLRDTVAARNDFSRAAQIAALSNPALAAQAQQMMSHT